MSNKHYSKVRITPEMVGMTLDVALFCHLHNAPVMSEQVIKKTVFAGKRGGKSKAQDLAEAIIAIEKMKEFEELDLMIKVGHGFPETEAAWAMPEKYLDVKPELSASGNRCRGCILDFLENGIYGCSTTGAMQMARSVTGTKCTDGFIYVLKDSE